MLAEIRAAAARREAKARASTPSAPTNPPVREHQEDQKPAPTTVPTESAAPTMHKSPPVELAPCAPTALSAAARTQLMKYKTMLRVGVKLPSVLRKMGEDAFDIALFDDALDSADIEQFYRPVYAAATQLGTNAPTTTLSSINELASPSAPQSVRKKIHIPVIAKSKTKLQVSNEDAAMTLWIRDCDESSDEALSTETIAAFNALFTMAPAKKGNKRTGKDASPAGSALIDKARAQNIAILLVGMKLTTDEWRECILNLSFEETFSENLKMLLPVWPTSYEERAIQVYDGGADKLGRAEEFLVGLRDIPRLKQKLECLHFRLLFSSRVFELRESMVLVVRGINQIIEKEKFAAAMQYIFRLCCLLNDGADASNTKATAKGFRMSALTQLLCARSFDPEVSVLRAIVQAMERDRKHLATFTQDLTLLSKCSCVSVGALHSELTSLEGGYDHLCTESAHAESINLAVTNDPKLVEGLKNFHAAINNFAAEADLELRGLRASMREMKDAIRRLNLYLEEIEATPFNEVIAHISAFVEAYAAERAKILAPEPLFSPPSPTSNSTASSSSDGEFEEAQEAEI